MVEESEDFRNGQNPSLNGDIGETTFTILKVSRAPVIHVVVDVSDDMGVTASLQMSNFLSQFVFTIYLIDRV